MIHKLDRKFAAGFLVNPSEGDTCFYNKKFRAAFQRLCEYQLMFSVYVYNQRLIPE